MKNYHTHTFRCNHASGDVLDYAQTAVNKGVAVLGMADHTPLPDNRWLGMRMSLAELPDYIAATQLAQKRFPELHILLGMECEWAQEYHQFFTDKLLGELEFDYLILGSHFFPYQGSFLSSHNDISSPAHLRAYADYLIKSMETGIFAFVAHPDLFGLSYLTWDLNTEAASRDILTAAQELKIPLEINGYGLIEKIIVTPDGKRSAYPWRPFWELAREYDVTVVVNSDAHHPEDVTMGIKEGKALAASLDLPLADLDYLHRR